MAALDDLEMRLLESPTARARFLADTLELLEKNGVDIDASMGDLIGSFDVSDGSRFLSGLAASSLVITRSNTGRGVDPGTVADTVVITRSNTGRGVDPGTVADTLVITRSNTGRGVDPGTIADTVVITRSNTGRLADIAQRLGQLAGELQQEALNLESSSGESQAGA